MAVQFRVVVKGALRVLNKQKFLVLLQRASIVTRGLLA